jgi:Crp-like helix-turn-helix protein
MARITVAKVPTAIDEVIDNVILMPPADTREFDALNLAGTRRSFDHVVGDVPKARISRLIDHLGGARDELHKRLYLICINAVARKHKCDVLATRQHVELKLQLFNSSEKRLARVLLLMANFGKEGKPEPVITKISQETLAEIIGTTRSRVSTFMNKFRDLGFINYNGELEVHNSLLIAQRNPARQTPDQARRYRKIDNTAPF